MIRTLVATGTAVLLAAGPRGAHRCECFGAGDACAEFARVDAVFAGRVRSVDDGRVEFAVTEAFRGIHQPTVVLYQPGSTCDFPFDVGKQYFVYAHEGFDERLTASICSRVGLLSERSNDLEYARRWSALPPGTRARVTGSVVRWLPRELKKAPTSVPVPAVSVVLHDGARSFSARADRKGLFQISDMPFGRYEVRADPPAGLAFRGHPPVNLLDPRGCTPLTLGVAYDGRVIGRVLNADGREVGGVALTLVQTTAANALPQAQTRTAIDGRFELDRVQPGSYFLRVDAAPGVLGGIRFFRRALPATGDARRAVRVRVGAGKRVAVGTIDLPADTSLVTMTGNVVDDQGRPAAAAEVYLMDYPHIQLEPTQRAGDDGRFVIAVVEGHRYFVLVNRHISDARGRTRISFSGRAAFAGGSSAPPISVVLKRHPR